jgi:predicted ATP-grasp superfamily ATP-dependent carboligase
MAEGPGVARARAASDPRSSSPRPVVKRVVILGSSLTALAIVREAHTLGLEPIIVDDALGIAQRSALAKSPSFRKGTEAESLDQVCALGGGDAYLVSTADSWLRFARRNRDALESAFGGVLHPSNPAIDICLSKSAFADWCLAHDLPVPRYCYGDDAACLKGLRYPLMVRPAETAHNQPHAGLPKAVEVDSAEALQTLIERFRTSGASPLIAESLLGQRLIQYSIPFARRGSEILSFVARKVRPPAYWCTVGTCVELSPNAEVESLARRAIEALDYFGIGEVEVLHSLDDGANYLVEINARPWMQYALATASGHDFLGFLLGVRSANTKAVKSGLTWLNFGADLYVCFSRSQGIIWRGELGLFDYLRSVLRANVHARFNWRDPKPWLFDSTAWIRSLLNR